MPPSSSQVCQNCNIENESSFQYCPNCGQKNTDGKITFSDLWSEFQDAIFNIESRTWLTFKSLFIPGQLTKEYFSGKHKRYVHPLRLLIVSSIMMILAMNFQDFSSATNNHYNVKEQVFKNHERKQIYKILKNITDSTNITYPEPQSKIITDNILTGIKDSLQLLLPKHGDRGYADSININDFVGSRGNIQENISKHDFLNMDENRLISVYKKDAGFIDRLIFKQKVKFLRDESQLFAALVGHTTWSILLMMPCLALVLYFLYIRHNYYFIEHLIFTFHLQSFSFLVLSILIAGMNVFPWWLSAIVLLILWIYLYVSMLKVYRQSNGKTISKFFILSFSYCVLFLTILMATVIISFLLL